MSLSPSPFLSLQLGDFSFPLTLPLPKWSDARVTAADSAPRLIFSPMARAPSVVAIVRAVASRRSEGALTLYFPNFSSTG